MEIAYLTGWLASLSFAEVGKLVRNTGNLLGRNCLQMYIVNVPWLSLFDHCLMFWFLQTNEFWQNHTSRFAINSRLHDYLVATFSSWGWRIPLFHAPPHVSLTWGGVVAAFHFEWMRPTVHEQSQLHCDNSQIDTNKHCNEERCFYNFWRSESITSMKAGPVIYSSIITICTVVLITLGKQLPPTEFWSNCNKIIKFLNVCYVTCLKTKTKPKRNS